jgi:hypothetical protein
MVLPGHIAGGYLAARGLLAFFHPGFDILETNALLVVGMLAAELPDIDLIRFYFEHKADSSNRKNDPNNKNNSDSHRDYITHAPFLWMVISLAIAATGYICGWIFISWIGWMVLSGTLSHFILDSLEHGVMWLWPSSSKRFVLKKDGPIDDVDARPGSPAHHARYIVQVYPKTLTFWFEIIITVLALLVFFKGF